MLELLTGIEAVRRVTSERVATERAPRRPPCSRPSRVARARDAVFAAVGALAGRPAPAREQSGTARQCPQRPAA
jgi:hypothetical protein